MAMSKLLLFDFRCQACGSVFEELVRPEVKRAECPACADSGAVRLVTGTHIDPRLGLDPVFSTMSDKWAKKHNQRRALEDAKARDHGIN